MLPKIPKRAARKVIEETKRQEAYKAGYDSGRQHGYEVGFAAAGKIAAEDAKRLKQEQQIKIQRAEAIMAIAQAITHLS